LAKLYFMKVRSIKPLGTAREFQCHEMFFSTTDLKGIILSGNDVFVRVSGYSAEELYGQPHNIIRHPDMPRAAFALLWANLKRGQPFAGYVKNLAKDGGYYWVFVVAVPASDNRYLSIRFKPGSALLGEVAAWYQEMLRAEEAALAAGGTQADAVAAGLQVATTMLEQRDFASYDLFSHSALNLEMKARDAQLQRGTARLFPATLLGATTREAVVTLYALGVQTYHQINELFRQLDGFVSFTSGLQTKAAAVLDSAEVFRLHALNVNLNSQHHGVTGGGVGVVASFLSEYSQQLLEATMELRTYIAAIAQGTETINARVAMARLQLEMLLYFQAEAAMQSGMVDIRQMRVLEECFVSSTTQALEALSQLRDNLPRLLANREMLVQTTVAIEMAQVRGLTEAVAIPDGEDLRFKFSEFRTRIGTTRAHLDELSDVMDRIKFISRDSPQQIAAIHTAAQRMRTGIEVLTVG